MSCAHLGDNEVSPLTIEDPKIVRDPPSGPDTTPAASSELMEQTSNAQRVPPIPPGRAEMQTPSFDFNGPYLGPLQTHSLPDLPGQLVHPQTGGSLKPALPGSLEYLCLPPGGQVRLVPLSQAMGQGPGVDAECEPSLGTTESPSMEPRDSPSLELRVEEQGPKDNPVTLPISSGGPEEPVVASGYVTPADLVLTLPTGPMPLSLRSSLGFPSAQRPSLCLRLPGVPPGSPGLPTPEVDDYVELPPNMSQPRQSPLGSPVPPVPSSPTVSLGEQREEVSPASPHPEGAVRASSIFPILSVILLFMGGLCIAASEFYKTRHNIILSAGIFFVSAVRLMAPHSLQVLHVETQSCNISWEVSQVSHYIGKDLEFEARTRSLGHSWKKRHNNLKPVGDGKTLEQCQHLLSGCCPSLSSFRALVLLSPLPGLRQHPHVRSQLRNHHYHSERVFLPASWLCSWRLTVSHTGAGVRSHRAGTPTRSLDHQECHGITVPLNLFI
ncbi:hypothetical protein NN561_002384 [Cricetulus griseus]